MNKTTTFLMFQENNAEEAINFYISLFDDSRINSITKYDSNGPGKEGSVVRADFTLAGQGYIATDSPIRHKFDFTPAVSIYVNCESSEELEKLWSELSKDGVVHMPLDNYGFSQKFGWTDDRFGVSWQLNLE
jgi:predicted 3-demethylubiquinone-9 3-methyltransferase (glyoxalase superfamily)